MPTRKAIPAYPQTYDQLHAFLHTVRCIQQHEAALCTLLHAIKTAAKPTAQLRKEILALLDDMPDAAYAADLAALRTALE